jgi:HAD superfamily hydrolase (TIGR01509 family)
MIRAFLFDLDGTLVQSEKLKAQAYAISVQRLLKLPKPDARAIKVYRRIVGCNKDIESKYITEKLGLDEELRSHMSEYGVSKPHLVIKEMRQNVYDEMISEPEVIRDNKWPYTLEILQSVKKKSCLTALVTNSPLKNVLQIVRSLQIEKMLDLLVTGDDVEQGKPSPMSYLLAINKLNVPAGECIALEDSVSGVRAASAAGVNVIAIATPFTNAGLHKSEIVEHAWIVHNPAKLPAEVVRRIEEHDQMERDNQKGITGNGGKK